jgi:hypothetical protein
MLERRSRFPHLRRGGGDLVVDRRLCQRDEPGTQDNRDQRNPGPTHRPPLLRPLALKAKLATIFHESGKDIVVFYMCHQTLPTDVASRSVA